MNELWKCYVIPIIGALTYYFLSLPFVDKVFKDWIPDKYNAIFSKGLLILIVLFLVACAMYAAEQN